MFAWSSRVDKQYRRTLPIILRTLFISKGSLWIFRQRLIISKDLPEMHPCLLNGRILPLNIGRSCRRCNRRLCDVTLPPLFASPPSRPIDLDRQGNFRKPCATSRTRVDSLPRRGDGNKHFDTEISAGRGSLRAICRCSESAAQLACAHHPRFAR